ncbi:DUF4037 domain-containing protein [Salana multivorans]
MAFDVAGFLRQLDAIFAAQEGPERAQQFLTESLTAAREAHDRGGELTVLNELMGFYRVTSQHGAAVDVVNEALTLTDELGATRSEAGVTTLINAATALRAAGELERAQGLYEHAIDDAERIFPPLDRRLAALHNNLALLRSDLGDHTRARAELTEALVILRGGTADPTRDTEIASTLANLALARFASPLEGAERNTEDDIARAELAEALEIFERVGAADPHAASALAALGEAEARAGRDAQAASAYARALGIIEVCFGPESNAYQVTAANLAAVGGDPRAARAASRPTPSTGQHRRPDLTGLELSRAYWDEVGPGLLAQFPEQAPRIAVGLVGHGSECYGFDDELSRDHDFGPELCLWLTAEDFTAIGAELQAAYDALPSEFRGFTRPADAQRTPRSRGANRRRGVFEIGAFFELITGYRGAPAQDALHEWLMLPEATLAAATNGAIFRDQLGLFSATRQGFKLMPEDVRLALASRRLGMIAQAGQYNVPRMLERRDGAAAWLAIAEMTNAAASLVYLVNGPARIGYLPYYKWQMAALRRVSGRMAARLPGVVVILEEILTLASTACFGTGHAAATGDARTRVVVLIEELARQIVADFRARRWTTSEETFLEWQRPYVESAITADWLRSL